jgi:hypothetical protein
MEITADLLRYRRGSPGEVIPLCEELGIGQALADIPLRYDQPGLFD